MNLYVECKSPTLCGADVRGQVFLVERCVTTINGEFYELNGLYTGIGLFKASEFVESLAGYKAERDRITVEFESMAREYQAKFKQKLLDAKWLDDKIASLTPDLVEPLPVVRYAVLVNDQGMKHLNVKVGNIYEIQRDIMVGAEQRFYIVDDNLNEIGGWRADRFVEIEDRPVAVGDEVICVDPGSSTYITLAERYTVTKVRGNGWYDLGDNGALLTGYPPKRFRAVKAAEQQHEEWADPEVPPKPKQIVLKDRLDDPSAYLTMGQVYEVKHVAIEGGESYYHIIDDMGKQSGGWYWQRFVEITDEPFAVGDLVVKLAGVVGSDFRDGRLMSVESIGQSQSKLYMDGGAYTFVSNNMLRKVVT